MREPNLLSWTSCSVSLYFVQAVLLLGFNVALANLPLLVCQRRSAVGFLCQSNARFSLIGQLKCMFGGSTSVCTMMELQSVLLHLLGPEDVSMYTMLCTLVLCLCQSMCSLSAVLVYSRQTQLKEKTHTLHV